MSGEEIQTGHTLTYDSNFANFVTVNGSVVASGYTLQNGDVITITSFLDPTQKPSPVGLLYSDIKVNTTTYINSETLAIENEDINVSYNTKTNSGEFTITINYTE